MNDPNRIAADAIIELVAKLYGLSPEDVRGPRRNPPLPEARAVAAAVIYDLVRGWTTTTIAHAFSGRLHSFVLKSVKRASSLERFSEARERSRRLIAVEML
jgi:chromosomal replication initiator protein